MQELNDILEGNEPVEEVQPVEAVQEPEVEATETVEATAEPEPTVEEEPAPTAAEVTIDPAIAAFKAKALDETSKRQDLERQLKELQEQQEPAKTPDVFDDQEGFVAAIRNEVKTSTLQAKIEISQDMMRSQHDDYAERETQFIEMAQNNPQLIADMQNAANPARFVYDSVIKSEKLAQMENVEDYEAKVRAEIEEKVRAEIKAETDAKAAKTAGIKPSLATVNGAGPVGSDTWTGPTPLTNILS